MAVDSIDSMRDSMDNSPMGEGASATPAPAAATSLLTDADVERIACAVVGKLVAAASASVAAMISAWKQAAVTGGGNGA